MEAMRTNCHHNGTAIKKFEMFADTELEQFCRKFFKVQEKDFVVACLTPRNDHQNTYKDVIDKVPQQVPQNIYFYSMDKKQEGNYFRNVTVNISNQKPYKFKMLKTDTLKSVDNKLRLERPEDKTPFAYQYNGQQLSIHTILQSIPIVDISLKVIPKIANLQVYQDGKLLLQTKIVLSLFKKKAKELAQKVAVQINKDQATLMNYQIFYEFHFKKVPEQIIITPFPLDNVKLHLNSKNYKSEASVQVQVILQNGSLKSKQIPLGEIKHKVPQQIASYVINQNELENKQFQTIVDNVRPLYAEQRLQQGRQVKIKILNPNSHQSSNYTANNHNVSQLNPSNDWAIFKQELKRLLSQVDSEQNDKSIKRCIINHMITKMEQ